MNTNDQKNELIELLQDKEYRTAYANSSIDIGVPSQILALREQRNWSQKELGEKANMAQESISRLEDPTRGSFTLNTLKRLAAAFDIALIVRFIPFSELVDWKLRLSLESLEVKSFDEESYFQEYLETPVVSANLPDQYLPESIASLSEYVKKRNEQMGKMVQPPRPESHAEQKFAQGAL